jgi:hypothetical protein
VCQVNPTGPRYVNDDGVKRVDGCLSWRRDAFSSVETRSHYDIRKIETVVWG